MTQTIKHTKPLVPKLRFPEFSHEWDKEKVGDLCDFIVPGRNKPTEFCGNIPWITTPDIEHNKTITFSKKNISIFNATFVISTRAATLSFYGKLFR